MRAGCCPSACPVLHCWAPSKRAALLSLCAGGEWIKKLFQLLTYTMLLMPGFAQVSPASTICCDCYHVHTAASTGLCCTSARDTKPHPGACSCGLQAASRWHPPLPLATWQLLRMCTACMVSAKACCKDAYGAVACALHVLPPPTHGFW